MSPDDAKHWYDALLPMARQGGPVLTIFLLIALVVSLWWLIGTLHDCVDRNRLLGERLVEQQQRFYQDVMVRLVHCKPGP